MFKILGWGKAKKRTWNIWKVNHHHPDLTDCTCDQKKKSAALGARASPHSKPPMELSKLQSVLQQGKEKKGLREDVKRSSLESLERSLDEFRMNLGAAFEPSLQTILTQQESIERQSVASAHRISDLFHKCTQWNRSYRILHQSYQDLSDVKEWAHTCHSDMEFIATGLEYVHNELQREHDATVSSSSWYRQKTSKHSITAEPKRSRARETIVRCSSSRASLVDVPIVVPCVYIHSLKTNPT